MADADQSGASQPSGGGTLLVPHPCPVPGPPADPERAYKWRCDGCDTEWTWNRPIYSWHTRESYGFLGLRRRDVEADLLAPGRWCRPHDGIVWVPADPSDNAPEESS